MVEGVQSPMLYWQVYAFMPCLSEMTTLVSMAGVFLSYVIAYKYFFTHWLAEKIFEFCPLFGVFLYVNICENMVWK